VRVTRLKLQNWRNFKQIEVQLDNRAFFIGPNASGKSNLLEALKFLRHIVADNGGFQEAVSALGGVGELRNVIARSKPNISIEIDLGNDEELKQWTYILEFNADGLSKRPNIVREIVLKSGEQLPLCNRPDAADTADTARLSQTALQQVNTNLHYRPIADFLRSIRYLHVVPQIIREPQRSSGKDDPYGGDLIERINATPKKTRDARLKRMEAALQIAVPQLENLELEIDKKGIPHLRARYNHWRPHGAWQREDRFSDGTLRLLGLIWALQESGGPLLLEEPELSLNAGVSAKLAPMFARAARKSGRQIIITTHSAELLSDGVDLSEIHLLQPGEKGTEVVSGPSMPDVQRLVDSGLPVGEAILPKAKARDLERLPLLDLMTS
jgi:predicted ATPase